MAFKFSRTEGVMDDNNNRINFSKTKKKFIDYCKTIPCINGKKLHRNNIVFLEKIIDFMINNAKSRKTTEVGTLITTQAGLGAALLYANPSATVPDRLKRLTEYGAITYRELKVKKGETIYYNQIGYEIKFLSPEKIFVFD